ncbi:MAG: hypothetical protein OIN66_09910 [Candidatus Methanoperedens sp.]|nr:hypothetical protein [Candidatus Methanoperedens sp.]
MAFASLWFTSKVILTLELVGVSELIFVILGAVGSTVVKFWIEELK